MKETPVRWIPFIAFFLYVYIEISIFIQVAHVLGVFMTLILVIFSSVVGMSLVRNQGFKNFLLMQQKMAAAMGGGEIQELQQKMTEAMARGDMAEYMRLAGELQQKMMSGFFNNN